MTAPPEIDQPAVELPETGSGERSARRRRTSHRRTLRRVGFVAAMVVLIGAIPVLVGIGYRTLRDTTAGRRIDAQNDPNKPRYEANVVPTPTTLLVETAADGSFQGVTMLSLGADDTGGAVVFIPASTTVTKADGTASTLSATYGSGDLPALQQAAADLVGLSFDQVMVVAAPQWQQYAAPVAPLLVTNPDKVVQVDARGRTTTLFPAGPLSLSADQIATYLFAKNPTESDLARLARKQALWTAWLASIKASTAPDRVPGETSTGLGRYLVGLARGNVNLSTLPVKSQPAAGGQPETFVADRDAIAALVAKDVPLPSPANPGDRTRVRLLSGVGPVGSPNVAAGRIVSAGGEVTIIGNADRFDYDTTLIIYYDDQFAGAAAKLRDALGFGEVSKSDTPTDTEDVTVILGRDAAAKVGGTGG